MSEDKNITDFKTEIDRAYQNALHSEKGGDAKWKTFMQSYSASPLSEDEIKMLLNSEMKITKGAYPLELRRVYEIIVRKYSAQPDEGHPNTAGNFNMDDEIIKYYQKIKPFSGMGDIFSNASITMNKYSEGLQKSKHHTIKCKNCGAPRLEEMQYDNCLFCGSKLFENAN
ncbi:MAG: hypothetical protein IPM38_14285 [Ignavibacteria bacterium]|nr:hypothetical protein [Ignavibacteria bacterium]